jgi:hypothetical protein
MSSPLPDIDAASSSSSRCSLERREVALENPLEQVRQELGALEIPDIAGGRGTLAEDVEDRQGCVVNRHDPALGDEARDGHELAVATSGSGGRDVEALAEVSKRRARRPLTQGRDRLRTEIEAFRQLRLV